MSKKLKVIFLMHSMWENRWTEKLYSQLSNKFIAQYDLHFVAFYDIQPYQKFVGSYHFLSPPEKTGIITFLKRFVQFRKLIIENKIDVVIGTNDMLNIFLLISTIFLKIRRIATVHSNPLLNLTSPIRKYAIILLYRLFFKIVCVSKSQEAILKSAFHLKNTITIYNYIDINREKEKLCEQIPQEELQYFSDHFNFISISRLDRYKGILPLLRVFNEFKKMQHTANLIILGDWEYRSYIEAYIKENNLEKNVFLLWSKANIYPYLLKSDWFLFPSLTEAFWLVLIESLLVNKIVISSDCPVGPKEILMHDYKKRIEEYPYYWDYGILFKSFSIADLKKYECDPYSPLDKKEEWLYRLLNEVYHNKKLYSDMYSKWFERASFFDINNAINQWKTLIW